MFGTPCCVSSMSSFLYPCFISLSINFTFALSAILKLHTASLLRRGWPDLDEFRNLIQNSTQITAIWSKSQKEEKFQYGGRLFLQTGSSYISAVDQDTSTKYRLLIDFDLRIKVTSLHTKPDVVLSHRCRHFEIVYDVIVARFGRNLVV